MTYCLSMKSIVSTKHSKIAPFAGAVAGLVAKLRDAEGAAGRLGGRSAWSNHSGGRFLRIDRIGRCRRAGKVANRNDMPATCHPIK